MFTFGFNTTRPLCEWLDDPLMKHQTMSSSIARRNNIMSVVSAIFPLMGIWRILGGVDMIDRAKKKEGKVQGCDDLSHTKSFAKRQIARGVGETLGLGLIFLIIDVIATVYNYFHYRNRPQLSY